jgi:hypothetical protein
VWALARWVVVAVAAPKPVAREHELTNRKARLVRENGKTADSRKPLHERESVRRALMRLPFEQRGRYASKIGVGATHLADLLNRVDGLRLAPSDGHAIAVERINGESLTTIRRRRRA